MRGAPDREVPFVEFAWLLVLRHGQSTWNEEHRWAGNADPPLSAEGCQAALDAARQLAGLSFSAVISSDLQRARKTAEIIAAQLGLGEVVADARLNERAAGEWTGMTSEQIQFRFPGQLEAWRRGGVVHPPGSESWFDFSRRIHTSLVQHGRDHLGRRVLVISHQGALRAIEHDLHLAFRKLSNLTGIWLRSDGDRLLEEVDPPV